MKTTYEKPIITIQRFAANEYVAACQYQFDCSAKVAGKGGILFHDNNKNGQLDQGDSVANEYGSDGFYIYNPCGYVHQTSSNNFEKGFVVDIVDFNKAKPLGWNFLNEHGKRTTFDWNKLSSARQVYIWNADGSGDQVGWHASSTQPTKNHS